MLKRYNIIKQLKSYRKALDTLKLKFGDIPKVSVENHVENAQILAETLRNSIKTSRITCASILNAKCVKLNDNLEINGYTDKNGSKYTILKQRNRIITSQLELISRLKNIFADKKYAKCSLGAAAIVATDVTTNDSLSSVIGNVTANIRTNPLTSDIYTENFLSLLNDSTSNSDISPNYYSYSTDYDYKTVTFNPTVSPDNDMLTAFTETVTNVISDSESGGTTVPTETSATTVTAPLTVDSQLSGDVIPEPPAIPDVTEFLTQLNALGEPTFESIGLGGWTPVGLIQHAFEYLHVTMGIPWWTAIVMGTVVIRLAMFPLVIMAQRNAAKMNNNLPGMQAIQLRMTEARQTGNQLEVARYSQELMLFMKEKDVNPFKNMIVPLAQMPVFISFFMGLRQMANVPVDSMRSGGLFWFTDLTVPDQFFALPVITSLTLWATIELGTDAARLNSQNLQTMKYVLRALPLVIIPFTLNFPGAILCYWAASNFISLGQVGFLKIPAVRDYFKIEASIAHSPENLPVKNKGFVGGIKDSWTNIKITKELEERRRIDDMQFSRAGKGPVVKTYKFDPTKVTAASTVSVKKA